MKRSYMKLTGNRYQTKICLQYLMA